MLLTNVARASLSDELLRDYESFLTQNGLRVWSKDSREALAMRARLAQDHAPDLPPAPAGGVRLRGLAGLSEFVEQAAPELAGNAMLCAVNQAAYLLKRQLESQARLLWRAGGSRRSFTGRGVRGKSRTGLTSRMGRTNHPARCVAIHAPAHGAQRFEDRPAVLGLLRLSRLQGHIGGEIGRMPVLLCKLAQVFQRDFQVLRPRGSDGQNFAGNRMGQGQFFRVQRGAGKQRAFLMSGLEPVVRFEARKPERFATIKFVANNGESGVTQVSRIWCVRPMSGSHFRSA